jgi:hypothetical protein
MNLRLRLFHEYLESRARPELLDAMIRRSITPMLLNLGVLIELKSGTSCTTPEEVIAASTVAGLDAEDLSKLLAFKHNQEPGSASLLHGCYTILIDSVEKALIFARQII